MSSTINSTIRQPIHYGRIDITTDQEFINEDNVMQVVQKAMSKHEMNVMDINYLINYEKGNQPTILNREKEVRPEINHKIVENHAHEIIDFKVGYLLGQPVTYVQRASNESTDIEDESTDDSIVNKLNEMLADQEKQFKDQQLGYYYFTCGIAYKLILPNDEQDSKSDFTMNVLDPTRTFIVYSADYRHKPMLGVTYWLDDENHAHYTAYTDSQVFKFSSNLPYTRPETIGVNGIGRIPIVEYRADFQRMGAFERVIPLLEAINLTTSDRVNGVDQFIQSLLWLNNVEIDETEINSLRTNGVIMTHSSNGQNASIEDIKRELDQGGTQTLIDDMYNKVLTITSVPCRGSTGGGNTGVALMLGESGWQMAEESAQFSENMFREGEVASLRVIANILRNSKNEIFENMDISDIEIKFNRNKISNLAVKTNSLATMINAGIHPRHAIITSDLFSDPQQVWLDSMPYMDNKQSTELDIANTDNQLRIDEYGNYEGVKSVFKRGVDKVQDVNSENLYHRDFRTPKDEI